jgi:hypothetical protein
MQNVKISEKSKFSGPWATFFNIFRIFRNFFKKSGFSGSWATVFAIFWNFLIFFKKRRKSWLRARIFSFFWNFFIFSKNFQNPGPHAIFRIFCSLCAGKIKSRLIYSFVGHQKGFWFQNRANSRVPYYFLRNQSPSTSGSKEILCFIGSYEIL